MENTKWFTYLLAILLLVIFLLLLLLPSKVVSVVKAKEQVDFITPELKAICACESVGDWTAEPKHLKNGNVLRGRLTPEDVGACQINEYYHLENSKRMGFNIYLWTGNVGYANYLYATQGTRPWNASKKCWNK